MCVYLCGFLFTFLNLIFIGGLLFFYKFSKMRAGGLARICPNSGWVEKSQPELIRVGSGPARFQIGSGWASPFKTGWPEIPALAHILNVEGKCQLRAFFLFNSVIVLVEKTF